MRREAKWIKTWKCNIHLPFLKSSSYSINPLVLSCLESPVRDFQKGSAGLVTQQLETASCRICYMLGTSLSITEAFTERQEAWWLFLGHRFALGKSRPAFTAHGWEQRGKHPCLGSAVALHNSCHNSFPDMDLTPVLGSFGSLCSGHCTRRMRFLKADLLQPVWKRCSPL